MTRPHVEPTVTTPSALAHGFAVAHGTGLRYVAAWKRWMVWDGTRWRHDDTQLASYLARGVCHATAFAVQESRPPDMAVPVIHRLLGTGTIAAVERLARTEQLLAAPPGQFDADPDLLNTPSGIVDTRTGEFRPHRPDAYLTRIAAVSPAAPGTPCPAWCAWLDRLTGGDAELQFYLQRVAGRALTMRSARPPSAAAPGNSIFIDTLSRILDDDTATAALRECLDLLPRAAARADAARDPELKDQLAREHPAILRWTIDGALAWREHGLATPACVRQAIDDHVAPGDFLRAWLDACVECVDPSTTAWESAGDLYASWKLWAEQSGEPVGSQKRFSLALAAHGFAPRREGSGQRGFIGLRLRRPEDAHEEPSVRSVESVEAADIRRPDPRPTAAATRPGARPAPSNDGLALDRESVAPHVAPQPSGSRDRFSRLALCPTSVMAGPVPAIPRFYSLPPA